MVVPPLVTERPVLRIVERGVATIADRAVNLATVRIPERLPLRLSHCSGARHEDKQCDDEPHPAFSFLGGSATEVPAFPGGRAPTIANVSPYLISTNRILRRL